MTFVKSTDSAAGSYADQVNAYIERGVPRMFEMGIRVVELDEGSVVGMAPLASNDNHLGSMYAGTLFGLAEMLGGALARPIVDFAHFYPTVKQVTIDFKRPARSDIKGTARLDSETIRRVRAEAKADGRSEFEVVAELTDADGRMVATTHGTYQVRSIGR